MIIVVLEPELLKETWDGPVGALFGGRKYIDLSSDLVWDAGIEMLSQEILRKCKTRM